MELSLHFLTLMKMFTCLALLISVQAWGTSQNCQSLLQLDAQNGYQRITSTPSNTLAVRPIISPSPLASRASTDSQRFGYNELKEFVRRYNISNKDEFVEHLPKEQKLRVAKIFASRSFNFLSPSGEIVQAATPDEPRVILANKDSSLLVALSTRTIETDLNLIEILEFNPAIDAYVPRVMQVADGKINFIDDPLTHFPKGHKANCARCHGEDIRPIYDSYHEWIGFWGQVNPGGGIEGIRRSVEYHGPEAAHLEQKNEAWKNASILRHLDRPEPNVQLTTDNTFIESEMISHMARRAVRKLAQSPKFQKYSIPLFLSLVNFGGKVDELPEFDPATKRDEIQAKLSKASEAKRARFLRVNSQWLTPSTNTDHIYISGASDAAALSLFAELMGVSISDWSLNFEHGVPAFSSGAKTLGMEILKVLKDELAARYPNLGLSQFDGSPHSFIYSQDFRDRIQPELIRLYRSGQ